MKKLLVTLCLFALLLVPIGGCNKLDKFFTPSQEVLEITPAREMLEDAYNTFSIQGATATIVVTTISCVPLYNQLAMLESRGIQKLHLVVISAGGSIIDMLAMVDMLERFKDKGGSITSHVMGLAASAAVPIYLMGDYRTAGHNAQLMIHPCTSWGKKLSDYTYSEADDALPTAKTFFQSAVARYNNFFAALVARKTSVSFSEAMEYLTTGDANTGMWYFSASQMLSMGFAHKLL